MKCAFLLSLLVAGSSAAGLRRPHPKIIGGGKSKNGCMGTPCFLSGQVCVNGECVDPAPQVPIMGAGTSTNGCKGTPCFVSGQVCVKGECVDPQIPTMGLGPFIGGTGVSDFFSGDDHVISENDIKLVENLVGGVFQNDKGKAQKAKIALMALGETLGLTLKDAADAMTAVVKSGTSVEDLQAMFEALKGSTIKEAQILIGMAEQQVPVVTATDQGFAPVPTMNAPVATDKNFRMVPMKKAPVQIPVMGYSSDPRGDKIVTTTDQGFVRQVPNKGMAMLDHPGPKHADSPLFASKHIPKFW